jgi:hypothetical protein
VQGSPLPRKRETRGGFHIQLSELRFHYPIDSSSVFSSVA